MDQERDELPPPAYSEQQEFDQKTSRALQESLTVSETRDEEEEWEEWDEAKFQTSAAQARKLEQIQRPVQRYPERYPPEKRTLRPATNASSSNAAAAGNSNFSGHGHSFSPSSSQHQIPEIPYGTDFEERSIPPPAFTAEGPSLDGPPYEEVVGLRLVPPRPSSAATSITSDTYEGGPAPVLDWRYSNVARTQRLNNATYSAHSSRPPRVEFNPSVAYSRSVSQSLGPPDLTTVPVNAAALYHSSVSAYMSSAPSSNTPPVLKTQRSSQFMSSTHNHDPRTSLDPRGRQQMIHESPWMPPVSPQPRYPVSESNLNATYFPLHPTYLSHPTAGTEPRWATSENQFPQMR